METLGVFEELEWILTLWNGKIETFAKVFFGDIEDSS